jgi:hypothetical protein
VLHIKSFDYTVGTLWNITIRYSGYNFGSLGLAAANAETVKKVEGKAVSFPLVRSFKGSLVSFVV